MQDTTSHVYCFFFYLICTYWSEGCLVQVGNGIELAAVGLQLKPYLWLPCGVTWESSQTVVVKKLWRTSTLVSVYGEEQ